MTDDREEIARIIDHEGYWERLDSCNHALATVSMTDDQRRALTAVRDDELRGTASSLAKADAILARQGPGPGEAVALTSALANACYLMSEPHLSGHRVILGFDTLDGATAAHVALSMAIIAATPTREAGNQGSSQGCGTGHSGEQLEPAVGATAALAQALLVLDLLSDALFELQERAESWSVSGVYFTEPCFTENVEAIRKADEAEQARASFYRDVQPRWLIKGAA